MLASGYNGTAENDLLPYFKQLEKHLKFRRQQILDSGQQKAQDDDPLRERKQMR